LEQIAGLTETSSLEQADIRLFCDEDQRWVPTTVQDGQTSPESWHDATK
jgi:hypothetical protein